MPAGRAFFKKYPYPSYSAPQKFILSDLVWLMKSLSKWSIKSYANALIAISEDEADGFEDGPGLSIIFNTVSMQEAEEAVYLREIKRTELGIDSGELAGKNTNAANITKIKGAWDFLQMATTLAGCIPIIIFGL